MKLEIRKSTEADETELENVHMEAFGQKEGPEIKQLVSDLLKDDTALPLLSLVAVDGGKTLGHVIFTRVGISGASEPVSAQILAPLAVVPGAQNKGIGNLLVREGLRQLRELGVSLVFVLGYPAYYTRFGFMPAGAQGLEAPYVIPEEHADAWMAQELFPGVIGRISGRVQCSDALSHPGYWRE